MTRKAKFVVETLVNFEVFTGVPVASLEWLAAKSRVREYTAGDHLFRQDEEVNSMYVVVSGLFEAYRPGSRNREVIHKLPPGKVTGQIPYSPTRIAGIPVIATDNSTALKLQEVHFREMITDHHELTTAMVQRAKHNISEISLQRVRDEQLLALGRMSAGLANELTRPASVMVHRASELSAYIGKSANSIREILNSDFEAGDADVIFAFISQKLNARRPALSVIMREGLEELVADWLEAHDETNGFDLAPNLVEYGFTPADLEELYQRTGQRNLGRILSWYDSRLNLDRIGEEISASSHYIRELIYAVWRYSGMGQENSFEPINLSDNLNQSLTILAHKARNNQVRIEHELEENIPPVLGAPGKLTQVWTYLIDNALDAMENSGGILRIRSWSDKYHVQAEVIDTGPGIPAELHSKIFDPFFTTKGYGSGTGLGLNMVKKIVEQHKGSISVNSQPGRTVFSVTFNRV